MFNFPWSNFHELNLDWILSVVKEAKEVFDNGRSDIDYAVETADEAKEIATQAAEATIPDNSVSTAKIQDYAVNADKLSNYSVTEAKLQNAAVTTAKIADSAVNGSKIADGAITSDKLNSGLRSALSSLIAAVGGFSESQTIPASGTASFTVTLNAPAGYRLLGINRAWSDNPAVVATTTSGSLSEGVYTATVLLRNLNSGSASTAMAFLNVLFIRDI